MSNKFSNYSLWFQKASTSYILLHAIPQDVLFMLQFYLMISYLALEFYRKVSVICLLKYMCIVNFRFPGNPLYKKRDLKFSFLYTWCENFSKTLRPSPLCYPHFIRHFFLSFSSETS